MTGGRISRAGMVEAAAVVIVAMASALLLSGLSRVQSFGIDFAPIWAAAVDPANAFDAQSLTEVQRPFVEGLRGLRPFAYSPPALLLFMPFGTLPFWVAYILFVTLGGILFLWSCRRAAVPLWVAVVAPVLLLLIIGQATLLVCGLLLAGLGATDWRIRGALIGVAAVIKPQLCLFVPLLLIFNRDWRTLLSAAMAVAMLSVMATFLFGPQVWKEWIAATNVVVDTVRSRPEFAEKMLQTHPLLAPLGVALVWCLRKTDAPTQLAASAGSALLVTPYAMTYELAVLVPAVVSATCHRPAMLLPVMALGILYPLGTLVVILCLVALLLAKQLPPSDAEQSRT